MRLYKQELKRLFHTKRIIVIFIFVVVMSALLAILPSEFSDANYLDEGREYEFAKKKADYLNSYMSGFIKSVKDELKIEFITETRYEI